MDESQLLEMQVQLDALLQKNSNCYLVYYKLATRELVLGERGSALLDVPKVISNYPESFLATGRFPQDQESAIRDFFAAIRCGVPEGQLVISFLMPDGTCHWFSTHYQLLESSSGTPEFALLAVTDITQRREMEEASHHLRRLARTDPLTGLYNRRTIESEIAQHLVDCTPDTKAIFLIADLDGFKPLNDSMGHIVGDRTLQQLGQRLLAHISPHELVGRLGGDEFVLLLPLPDDEAVLMQRMEVLHELFSFRDGQDIAVTASFGLASYPQDGTDFLTLYRRADSALYQAKALGGNQTCRFKYTIQPENAPSITHLCTSEKTNQDDPAHHAAQHRLLKHFTVALKKTYVSFFSLNITQDVVQMMHYDDQHLAMPSLVRSHAESHRHVAEHYIHPDDQAAYLAFFDPSTIAARCTGADTLSSEFRRLDTKGQYRWTTMLMVPIGSDTGDEEYLCFCADITDQKRQAQETLSLALARQAEGIRFFARSLSQHTTTMILAWVPETGEFYCDAKASQFTFAQHLPKDFSPYFMDEDDIHPKDWKAARQAARMLNRGSQVDITVRLRKTDSTYLWCRITASLNRSSSGAVRWALVTLNDVDGDLLDHTRLAYQVEYDTLTGCSNFEKFRQEVATILSHRGARDYVLCSMDLKGFKLINDMFGYDMGDDVLRYLARLLQTNSTEDEAFCRLTGDHFLSLRRYRSSTDLFQRFSRMSALAEQYPPLQERNFTLQVACGFYAITRQEDILPLSDMMDRCNLAQKTVRHLPGNQCALYREEMRLQVIREKKMEGDMRSALITGQFQFALQPIVSLHPGSKMGAEALTRWVNPQTGAFTAPGDFIPLFENNGFIANLDEYIYCAVCRYLAKRMELGQPLFRISVNVSRITLLQADFCQQYCAYKESYGIPDGFIELECTESTAVGHSSLLSQVMTDMRARGFRFALDDFGSGHSSLNLLKDIPVDVLKLDASFLQGGLNPQRREVVISSIIAMAKSLGIEVVAEGVETQDQLMRLKAMNCDMVQGFLISKPLLPPAFETQFGGQL